MMFFKWKMIEIIAISSVPYSYVKGIALLDNLCLFCAWMAGKKIQYLDEIILDLWIIIFSFFLFFKTTLHTDLTVKNKYLNLFNIITKFKIF